MKRWLPRYASTPVIATGLTLALAPSSAQSAPPLPPQGGATPAEKKPATAPAPTSTPAVASEPEDDPWEERKIRAREDVEYLEASYKAALAEYREAEQRSALAQGLKTDLDRQKQKGYISTFMLRQAEMGITENQSQVEMRRVDLKDAEIRLARARRRLKAVERSGAVPEPESFQAEDRFRDLEIKYERLRRKAELSERKVETLRVEIELMRSR